MLVKKENEMQIWTDVQEKGQAKHCFIGAIVAVFVLMFCILNMEMDYTVKETYYLILLFVGTPTSSFLIAGFINLINENRKKELRAKINSEYIEINNKKQIKKINLKQINKVNAIPFKYGNIIEIFYIEDNIEKKYSFPISTVNRGLVVIALKQYKPDIIVNT